MISHQSQTTQPVAPHNKGTKTGAKTILFKPLGWANPHIEVMLDAEVQKYSEEIFF